jgi:hypothetical protein
MGSCNLVDVHLVPDMWSLVEEPLAEVHNHPEGLEDHNYPEAMVKEHNHPVHPDPDFDSYGGCCL